MLPSSALPRRIHRYALVCRLAPRDALARVAALLAAEGVTFTSSDLSLESTSTPLAFLGFQRRAYTRRNWVGLNPFAHVSGIAVQCERVGATTAITVRVDGGRAALLAAWWACCAGFVGLAVSPAVGVLAIGGVGAVAWWLQGCFLGGYLIATEIQNDLGAK